jgi:MFS family permease
MAPSRRANVLRNRDFRLLFIGQSVSQIGTQAVTVAMALYITRRTGSATDLAVILGAGSLPFVVLIVFGGVWADRLPRQQLIIASDSVRAVLHLLLGVLILLGHPAIWSIALIEAASGCAEAFFQPAYVGLIPQTVPEGEIQAAQALRGMIESASPVIGPVLATTLVLTVGAGEAFLFDAASYLFGAALMIPVRPRRRDSAVVASGKGFIDELRAGYQEVRSRVWVWATILAYTAVVVCALVTWLSLGPLVVRNAYGHVGFYGVLVAVYGVASVLASILAAVWHPRHPLRLGLGLGMLWALVGVVLALAPARGFVVAAAFVSGGAGALTGIWWETSLARHIPPAALSRVSAWDHMGSLALMPIGFAVVGPLASVFGARWVLGIGGGLGMLAAGLALIPRSVRELPASPPEVLTATAIGPPAPPDAPVI